MDLDTFLPHGRLDSMFPLPPTEPFTFASALAAGINRHMLRGLVSQGLVTRAISGVYIPAHLDDTPELRARALRLVVPDDCVVVDRHAGWLLGAPMVLAPGEHLALRPLSLYRPAGRGRLRNSLTSSGERNLVASDVTEVAGIQVTTPLRTALDLGRVRHASEAITGIDAMLRRGGFTRAEMLDSVRRFRGMRWVTTLRGVAPLADPRSESPGESVLRLRCHECGLPEMQPQLEVTDAGMFLARLDLADPRRRLAVEYDGAEWHGSPAQQEHDRSRRDAVRRTGWTVEAFTASDVFGPARTVEDRLTALDISTDPRRRRTA